MSEVNDDRGGCTDPSDALQAPDGDDDPVVCRPVGDAERVSDTVLSTILTLGEVTEEAPRIQRQEPLYETLDLGALDELFTDGDRDGAVVQFPYDGYVVTVCEESIRVDATDVEDVEDVSR